MLDKKSNSFKGKVEEAKNQEAKIKADTISNNEKVQQLQKDLDEKTTAHIVVSCEYDEFVVARAGLEALLEDAKARMKEADLQYKTSLEMASNARIELEKEKKRLQEDFNGSIMNHRKAEEHFQAQILKTEKMLMKLSNERIDLVSEQQVQSATGKAGPPLVHYHFMMDESRSMNSSFLSSFG